MSEQCRSCGGNCGGGYGNRPCKSEAKRPPTYEELEQQVELLQAALDMEAARGAEVLQRVEAAKKVYETRKAQVEGFANKTATDMYEALEG